MKSLLLLVFILFYLNIFGQDKRIARGHSPGEIYLSSTWYIDSCDEPVYMYKSVFHSTNSGQDIEMKHYFDDAFESYMPWYNLISDALEGTVYYIVFPGFYTTFNYGNSWQYIPAPGRKFAAGCTEGEIYLLNPSSDLRRSTDFGESYSIVNDDLPGGTMIEVGTEPGEIYTWRAPTDSQPHLRIYYSDNHGQDFVLHNMLDTITGGFILGHRYPILTRGNSAGEVYLVTWHKPGNYHIHHSMDYGQTFNLKYTSSGCNLSLKYSFTAGSEPGNFYVTYSDHVEFGCDTYINMFILHSSDTAKTFTEYLHYLTPSFPTGKKEKRFSSAISCFPNPFSSETAINIGLNYSSTTKLQIYSIDGTLIKQIELDDFYVKDQNIKWDGCDATGTEVPPGVYLVRIFDEQSSKTLKILKN